MIFSILMYSMVMAIISWYFNTLNASPSCEHRDNIIGTFNRCAMVMVLFMFIVTCISLL